MTRDFQDVEDFLELLIIEEDTYSEAQINNLKSILKKCYHHRQEEKQLEKHLDFFLLRQYINNKINMMFIMKRNDPSYYFFPFAGDFPNCIESIKNYWENDLVAGKRSVHFPRKFDVVIDCLYDSIHFYNMYNIYTKADINKINTSLVRSLNEKKEMQEKTFRENIRCELNDAIQTAKESVTGIAESVGKRIAAQTVKEEITHEVENKAQKIVKNEIVNTLGIFAGIIIAVVAAFIYSSSVINNILTVDTYKLIFVSLTVGIVFIDIIFSMFYYVERIKTSCVDGELPKEESKEDKKTTDKTMADKEKSQKGFWHELCDSTLAFIKNHTCIFMLNVIFAIILVFFSIFYEPVDRDDSNDTLSNGIYCCVCASEKENGTINSIQTKCSCECHCKKTDNQNEEAISEDIVTEDISEDMTDCDTEDFTNFNNNITGE